MLKLEILYIFKLESSSWSTLDKRFSKIDVSAGTDTICWLFDWSFVSRVVPLQQVCALLQTIINYCVIQKRQVSPINNVVFLSSLSLQPCLFIGMCNPLDALLEFQPFNLIDCFSDPPYWLHLLPEVSFLIHVCFIQCHCPNVWFLRIFAADPQWHSDNPAMPICKRSFTKHFLHLCICSWISVSAKLVRQYRCQSWA